MANLKLNRQDLAKFLNDARAIRAFEELFTQVIDEAPSANESIQISSDTAIANASQALNTLAEIANNLALLLNSTLQQDAIKEDSIYITQEQKIADEDLTPALALGTLAQQNSDRINITGGTIAVGALSCSGLIKGGSPAYFLENSASLFNNAGALLGTLTNSPRAGNPRKWISILDNGVAYYVPAF